MYKIKRTNIPKEASGIYQIKSKLNGKVYVGSAVNFKRRKKNHFQELKNKKHVNRYLQNHYNKYGKTDLQFSILKFCEKEMLIEKEQFYIDTLEPEFNICKIAGSILGIIFSKETKQKMSESQTGRKHSKETKQKMSTTRMGTHPSEETIQKMSTTKTGTYLSEEIKRKISKTMAGKNHPNYGKHASIETRQKNREANIGKKNPNYGKPLSEEHRRKISKALTGIHHSEKNKQKNREAQLGKHLSEEHKQKIRITIKEYWKKRKEKTNDE